MATLINSLLSHEQSAHLAEQVMAYCDELAHISQTLGIIDRRYLTPEHKQANDKLAQWAAQSQLQHWEDEAGNQWIRLPAQQQDNLPHEAPRVIMGSHTDSVPDGGRYDGPLGVVGPLVLLKHFAESRVQFPFHLDVVGFGDEEGTRFGSTLLGSSAICGMWQSRWRELTDENGVSLAQAMYDFGLDVSKVSEAQIDSSRVLAYLETHIEQGPVLEERGKPLAAVKGIAGARRFNITLKGQAGHAGTVPMVLRHDPLVIASHWITQVQQMATATSDSEFPVVATVGRLEVRPGAVNVVPGEVRMSLDIRSLSDEARDAVFDSLQELLEVEAAFHQLECQFEPTHNASAVSCNDEMTRSLNQLVTHYFGDSAPLVSGAGHDAMALAMRVPATMLFVRCKGGVSHHPDESIMTSDAAAALQVMAAFVTDIARKAT
ncbi:allantoate amidohydrolase [Vibrio sp. SM6]|uniref:Allantoate amidohydrolase n=1 Tax=Vibrio agarilyticus TaxID=2726741 RepID=A0A7X8TTD3_9VIBR|nr:allantoate amidohydrolase [Vibrio agarilyticus]NLS14540.1 allantoate amidohydrolase [Vibrio agarilyticus]